MTDIDEEVLPDAPLPEWTTTELEDERLALTDEIKSIQSQLAYRNGLIGDMPRSDRAAWIAWRDWRGRAITAMRYKEKSLAEVRSEIKRRNIMVSQPPGVALSDDPAVLLLHVHWLARRLAEKLGWDSLSSADVAVLDHTRAFLKEQAPPVEEKKA